MKKLTLLQSNLIPLANILTPGLSQYHLEQALVCQLPSQLLDWSFTEKIPCYNVQVRRSKPTNDWTIKFANYLHLQPEQLLGTC